MSPDQKSDLILERFLLGELPPKTHDTLEAALLDDPQLCRRLDELRRSNQAILDRYPPELITGQLRQRIEKTVDINKRKRLRRLPTALKIAPLLAAVWLIFILVLPDRDPLAMANHPANLTIPDEKDDVTIAKGSKIEPSKPRLIIYQKISRDQISEIVADSLLQPGDLIQIGYIPGNARYGMIFSIDGRKTVTLHHPDSEDDNTALTPSGKQFLVPSAYELDDAPAFERFFFITSDQPFSARLILERIRHFTTLVELQHQYPALGSDFSIQSISVRK